MFAVGSHFPFVSAATDSDRSFFSFPVSRASVDLVAAFPSIQFTFGDQVHDWYKFLLLQAMTALPARHVINLETISVHTMELERRGVVSFRLEIATNTPHVKLRLNPIEFPIETGFVCETVQTCLQKTSPLINREFTAVAIHEIGHAFDLGASTRGLPSAGKSDVFKDGDFPFYRDDPSLAFYSVCFATESVLSGACDRFDFVSAYAKTDVFEDFSETMTAYVLDGANFYDTALQNARKNRPALLSKYNFFRDRIFDGKDFRLPERPRRNVFTTSDATRRAFALKSFWLDY